MSAVPYRYATASATAEDAQAGSSSAAFLTTVQLGKRFRGTAVMAYVRYNGGLQGDGIDWADSRWQFDYGNADIYFLGPFRAGSIDLPIHLNFDGDTLSSLQFRISPASSNWDLGLWGRTYDGVAGIDGGLATRICVSCTLLILATPGS